MEKNEEEEIRKIDRRKLKESLELFVRGCEEGNLFSGDSECIWREIKEIVRGVE